MDSRVILDLLPGQTTHTLFPFCFQTDPIPLVGV